MWKCKHCLLGFQYETTSKKANHSRWCASNPSSADTSRLKAAQSALVERKLGRMLTYQVSCERCTKEFTVDEREKQHPKRDAYFCSRSCANSVGGKAKVANMLAEGALTYRTMCFKHHAKECIICGEDKIVSVHHYDENHLNNEPSNLVPLCPTHHQYWHSPYQHLVADKIHGYVRAFKEK